MLKKILIDCDTGIDDSLALLYALKHPQVRVLGISTGFGNTSAAQAAENTLRIIRLAQPGYEVPVFLGAAGPLEGTWAGPNVEVHGPNGLGGVELPASGQTVSDEPAADWIVRMARQMPGELTLVTLGRLTNLALALRQEPRLPWLLRSVVTMGGAVAAPGNASPVAEANILGDPEAADMVMQAGFDLLLVGLDVTYKVQLSKAHLDALSRHCSPENRPIAEFLQAVMAPYFDFNRHADHFLERCPTHDPLAMLLAVDPTPGTYRKMPVRVECGGMFCRGMIVADRRALPMEGPCITVCTDIDAERALERLLSVFTD